MAAALGASLVQDWRRLRSLLRAVLAVACLIAQLISPAPALSLVTVFTALFTGYAVTAFLWHKLGDIQRSIAGLLVEAVFFIVFAAYGGDRAGWLSSIYFVYLMMAAALDHEWFDVLVIVTSSLAVFVLLRQPSEPAVTRAVLVTGLTSCVLAFYRRGLAKQVAEAAVRERELRSQVDHVRDAERQRIAGDFHDGPLQSFIAMQVRLDVLGTLLKRDRASAVDDLKELQQIAKSQVAEIRSYLRSMKPLEVDANDLLASTRRIVEYFQKDTGVNARFISTETSISIPPDAGQEILQILREALNNVHKHAKAGRVAISLEQSGRVVELTVDDDGTGFAFSGSFSLDELDLLRLGPQSIKRRVRSLGGELQIESRPGHGASLHIRVPY